MVDELPEPYNSQAGQAAFFALRICLPWADAALAAYRRWSDHVRQAPTPLDDDWRMRHLSETMVGLVALERALLCARWVVANRPETADRFSMLGWDAEQLDAVWSIVKVRRDAFVHVEGWVLDESVTRGGVGATDRTIQVTGLPDLDVGTWQLWAVELHSWCRRLLDEGFVAVDGPAQRPARLDQSDWPAWTRGPLAVMKSRKGSAPGR